MKFFLSRYIMKNQLEVTGDDLIFIDAFVHTGDQKEVAFPIFIPYYKLVEFIESIDVATSVYLNKVRSGINGYGPKNTKIFEILNQEDFDFEKYIRLFIENKDEDYVEMHLEWVNRVHSLPKEKLKEVDKSIEKISKLIDNDFIKNNINLGDYKDAFDQTIHELTLKFFPQLFEKDEKHMFMYRRLLVNMTLSFCAEIDRLNHGKFNPNWEEDYERQKVKK